MLEIVPRQVNRSFGGVAVGLLAAHLLTTTSYYEGGVPKLAANVKTYRELFSTATFGGSQASISEIEEPLVGFFSTLLSSQQRLGEEFEQVLYDNLWDLYAR
jgi:hypothetical protein